MKSIFFMKVGPHSGYSMEEIYEMKKREEGLYGNLFWGYAGTLCHPKRVSEFIEKSLEKFNILPKLVMSYTPSVYISKTLGRIKEYSIDDKIYYPLSPEVILIGNKFAVVCNNICKVNITLDLNKYQLVNGKNGDQTLGEFIRYHINKGCAFLTNSNTEHKVVNISYIADIVYPYCVYLK